MVTESLLDAEDLTMERERRLSSVRPIQRTVK
jgi:hypothetical protein